MRALSICLGLALSLGFLVGDSKANITMSKTSSDPAQTFSSGGVGGFASSGSKSVSFTSADFANHPTAEIISISVSINFAKLKGTGANDLFPFYNEIKMTFRKAGGGPTTTLIDNGPAIGNPASDSFGSGFAGDPGFDGTVTFSSTAAQEVNATPGRQTIPNTPGTSYLPAGTGTTPWNTFTTNNVSAIGTFTLDLEDVDGGADMSLDPLIFRGMTVTITAVPEPSSFAAVGLLTVGGTFIRRRRARG